ncbi:hypothetical protein [Bacillus bombysepticus]|uniref:hypothetical protein n=1 Tax=Bacillus bombysepticus TaxID=658666 RepID=UPI0030186AD8
MEPTYYDGRYANGTGTPGVIVKSGVPELPLEVRKMLGGNPFVLPEIVVPKKEA